MPQVAFAPCLVTQVLQTTRYYSVNTHGAPHVNLRLATPRLLVLLVIGMSLAACARPPLPAEGADPYESVNRAWFEHNLALDGALSRDTPETQVAAESVEVEVADNSPQTPRRGRIGRLVSNFGANLGLPSTILNDLLQIRPDRASENTIRLVINTTIGLGGLFDPAGAMGIHGRRSDFGETLHRWGVGEGDYLVLPLLGPSTERDAAGMVVDMALDPLRFVLPGHEYGWSLAARGAARLADRSEYADLLDANVMNTSDPYAQARLLYLQTRRYHLGIEAPQDEFIDPYAEF